MIFDLTKNYVPKVYSDSRDFRVFLKLLGVLMSTYKYNIDNFSDLYSPEEVPDNLLELLARLVGYDYDPSLKLSYNRIITKYFPYLIRNRGSRRGFEFAIALSINTSEFDQVVSMDDIIINFDYEKGIIKIYYPQETDIKKNLIEVVRPVGMTVELYKSEHSESNEELDLYDRFRTYGGKYDRSMSEVGSSQINFEEIQEDPLESLSEEDNIN